MNEAISDCIVIGSGPSGTACADALLKQGRSVRMLDAGLTLEPERAEMVRAARAGAELLTPATAPWTGPSTDGEGIPRKLLFGSDYPYRDAAEHLRLHSTGVGLEPSFALGGHSNVWGAAVMPYVDRDIADWPIRVADLALHYEACARMLQISAEEDDLAEEFPLYAPPAGQLPPSAQAGALLARMTRHRGALAAAGVRFGRARVAIRAPHAGGGCRACGLCLGGCAYDAIFKTTPVVEGLVKAHGLSYTAGVVVDSVAEQGDLAEVRAHDLKTGAPRTFTAKRVFIAGGPIGTTSILLRSGRLTGAPARLKDSQYFLLPLLTATGVAGDVREERLHTLSQLFIRIVDESLGHPATQFLQVYSYNALLADELRRKLGPLYELFARPVLGRMIIVQGYLHSDLSGGIDVALDADDRIRMTPVIAEKTRPALGRLTNKLFSIARFLGAVPASPLLRVGEPGRGFHAGGSFPMRTTAGARETDVLGRPFGWRRVHAVDASVLPSIAATTITFTVMANARRIGMEAAKLD